MYNKKFEHPVRLLTKDIINLEDNKEENLDLKILKIIILKQLNYSKVY